MTHIYRDYGFREFVCTINGVHAFMSVRRGKSIIKPVAFKPVAPMRSSTAHPQPQAQPRFARGSSTSPFSSSDSYETSLVGMNHAVCMSTPKSYLSQSQCSLSQNSFFLEDDNWYSQLVMKLPDTPGYISRGKVQRSSTFNSDDLVHTPSPSDSGITELEAMLREKDSEISYLRETLEQNEQVIFKVYEEKEQSWQREYAKLRSHFETSLASYHHRVAKAEQLSAHQCQQAQADRQKALSEVDELKSANQLLESRVGQLQDDLSSLRAQLEEAQWSVCEKSGEISLLKSQLEDSKGSQDTRTTEVVALRSQLKDSKHVAEEKSSKAFRLEEKLRAFQQESSNDREVLEVTVKNLQKQLVEANEEKEHKSYLVAQLNDSNETLKYQLGNLREEIETTKEAIADEKRQWMNEKDRVIKYQKQLNSNFLQIVNRNKDLEKELAEAHRILGLEIRDESHC